VRIIYLDKDFKCYLENDGTMEIYETDFFNNKCDAFIEGYRCVPCDKTWIREDGVEFKGEMIAPWRDYNILAEFQGQYEKLESAHMEELGALIEEIYLNDMEVIDNV
jgi:hypothetical protein